MQVEMVPVKLDVEVGQNVRVLSGPLESFIGTVTDVDAERQKVRVSVSMFGRETPVELDFTQVVTL